MEDIQSPTAEIRQGKKERTKKDRYYRAIIIIIIIMSTFV